MSGARVVEPADVIVDGIQEYAWSLPRAKYVPEHGAEYFGSVAADGKVLACAFDHQTGARRRIVVGQAVVDDHNMPGLHFAYGYRPVIAWTNHNADGVIHLRVGAVNSIFRWGGDQPLTSSNSKVSYTQLAMISALSTPGVIATYYLISRHLVGSYSWRLRKVTVDQVTGAVTYYPSVVLVSFAGTNQGYLTTAEATLDNGHQGLRMAYGYNPRNSTPHDIFYMELDFSTGALLDVDGTTVLGNLDGTNLPIGDTRERRCSPSRARSRPGSSASVPGRWHRRSRGWTGSRRISSRPCT